MNAARPNVGVRSIYKRGVPSVGSAVTTSNLWPEDPSALRVTTASGQLREMSDEKHRRRRGTLHLARQRSYRDPPAFHNKLLSCRQGS